MSPEYVEYGSLMTLPAPFHSVNTELQAFWFKADPDRLRALCDKVFTEPSAGAVEVSPLGHHVMLSWGRIERVTPELAPYRDWGAVAEPQVAVWMPVSIVRRDAEGQRIAERFAMFVPYIWLDNAMSLATGRELFGYPKSWGWLGFPADEAEHPREWTVDAFGLNYSPEQIAGRHPLLRVCQGDDFPGARETHESLPELARHFAGALFDSLAPGHILHGLELGAELGRDLLDHSFPHIFLKQFRSVEDGLGASLQQITELRYRILRLQARPLSSEFTLFVEQLDSHPVLQELGLGEQTTRLAMHVDMDFLVGGGRVLWDASASRPPATG